MSSKKRTVYRDPVTNKFISKKQWEELNKPNPAPGSDFDVDQKYDTEIKDFMKKIEEDFNNLPDEVVETSPFKDKVEGWKFFFHKFRFWE